MADEFKTELELMKKDIRMISKLVEKFDTTIDKLQQVATDIQRIVAIQDQKMLIQEKINAEVDKALECQEHEHSEEIKALTAKLNENHNTILKELQTVKTDITALEKWRYAAMAIISVITFVISTFAKSFLN